MFPVQCQKEQLWHLFTNITHISDSLAATKGMQWDCEHELNTVWLYTTAISVVFWSAYMLLLLHWTTVVLAFSSGDRIVLALFSVAHSNEVLISLKSSVHHLVIVLWVWKTFCKALLTLYTFTQWHDDAALSWTLNWYSLATVSRDGPVVQLQVPIESN